MAIVLELPVNKEKCEGANNRWKVWQDSSIIYEHQAHQFHRPVILGKNDAVLFRRLMSPRKQLSTSHSWKSWSQGSSRTTAVVSRLLSDPEKLSSRFWARIFKPLAMRSEAHVWACAKRTDHVKTAKANGFSLIFPLLGGQLSWICCIAALFISISIESECKAVTILSTYFVFRWLACRACMSLGQTFKVEFWKQRQFFSVCPSVGQERKLSGRLVCRNESETVSWEVRDECNSLFILSCSKNFCALQLLARQVGEVFKL